MLSPWIFSKLILIGILQAGDAIYPKDGPSITLAKRGEFPHMVLVYTMRYENRLSSCGGAIIDRTHILTAAHCIFYTLKEKIAILAGGVYQQLDGSEHSRVATIHLPEELTDDRHRFETWYGNQVGTHDEWQHIKDEINCSFYGNDIAVLTLSRALPFGDNIQAVNLPDSSDLPYCQLCKFSGWGQNERDGSSADCLHWVYFMIRKDRLSPMNNSTEFMAEDPMLETRPLKGDSGGPLVFNKTVYGVLSRGKTDCYDPPIFSKVFSHMHFIRKALEN